MASLLIIILRDRDIINQLLKDKCIGHRVERGHNVYFIKFKVVC